MTPSVVKKRGRARAALMIALLTLATIFPPQAAQQVVPVQAVFFELELPELNMAPTSQPEIGIPSPTLGTIVLHVLRPQADQIDYGQIGTHVNGQPAMLISQIFTGERGKMVRIDLTRLPDFRLVAGRNTVEILARNRRGRAFYASFVLNTATVNRNNEFSYQVTLGSNTKQPVPPELVLQEPEREVLVPPSARPQKVRLTGVATAVSAVARLMVNGESVAFKRGEQVSTRGLKLVNEQNRVGFDFTYNMPAGTTQIVVEAVDAEGNRTQLKIPVRVGEKGGAQVFTGKKYALVVGVSKFRNNNVGGLSDLRFADADALSLSKLLQSPLGGAFPADNVLLLINEQATLARLQEAMNSFILKAGPEDLLLVFFASHGFPDPLAEQNLYFVTHDTHPDRMSETAFLMKDFYRILQTNVRARRMILLVDTCHSAGLTVSRGVTSRGLSNNLVNLWAEKFLYNEEGKAVITSSDVNESSQEAPHWGGGHGVFTHFLLEGMRGRADIDADHLVTVGELFRYVRRSVRQDTEFRQNPRMLVGTNDRLTLSAVARAAK